MAPLEILICGGGVAGPSVAFWLSRAGHNVTIVERFPSLRAKGAQIDLREQGIEVVKRMGLLETIRSKCVDEAGVALVNSKNEAQATIYANKTGKGVQTATSEYEIMRGDMVQILYDATKDKVRYEFGKTVESFEQDDTGVDVSYTNGQNERFDILIGADGQGSRIRKAILPPSAPDPVRKFGCYIAYWLVPRTPIDTNIRKMYQAPQSRMIMCRSHSPEETQAYFWLKDDADESLHSLPHAPLEQQKAFWSSRFKDAGWQSQRFIAGMQKTENFYCQELVHVRLDSWSRNRVVLLGDAGYCASPMSGMGTTSAMIGAYILAHEIDSHTDDLPMAFAEYERKLRPLIERIQEKKPKMLRFAFYETSWGIWISHKVMMLLCWLRVFELVSRFKSAGKDGGYRLPEYSGI